jgi:hypothetical protein
VKAVADPFPPVVVTTTSTLPAGWSGARAVIVSGPVTWTVDATTPPKVTDVAPVKPAPVIVTGVVVEAGPRAGSTEVTVGGSTKV